MTESTGSPYSSSPLSISERFVVLESALPDVSRAQRCGRPEAVFCPGKTNDQIIQISQQLFKQNGYCLCTRISPEQAQAVIAAIPTARYESKARLIMLGDPPPPAERLKAGVLAAGTADQVVAAEVATILSFYGWNVEQFTDVGIAGIHRLLAHLEKIRACDCLVVVAGMEGALPTAVAGLVSIPVIAVPTSVGYGVNFGGIAPLLTMLNSCAAGLTVVNIDNGFGAASAADAILRLVAAKLQKNAE